MKRAPTAAIGNGSNSASNYPKKSRMEDSDPLSFEDELVMIEKIEGDVDDGNQETRWARPMPPHIDSTTSLSMQWLDIDLTSGDPLSKNPDGGAVIGSLEGPVPVIRLYGVTNAGFSVMASIHGFTPYFYVAMPTNYDSSAGAMGSLRSLLDQRVRNQIFVYYAHHSTNKFVK